jgi:hypothetical protein|tara:strand:+ start:14886 stop:15080 length:195 start_codon:yes stop_codon:yes gene_type:complete
MPIEIKELIVKGTVQSKKEKKVDIIKIIDEKLGNTSSESNSNQKNLIEQCVQEVLLELKKQSDY